LVWETKSNPNLKVNARHCLQEAKNHKVSNRGYLKSRFISNHSLRPYFQDLCLPYPQETRVSIKLTILIPTVLINTQVSIIFAIISINRKWPDKKSQKNNLQKIIVMRENYIREEAIIIFSVMTWAKVIYVISFQMQSLGQ
jgi:hypothetical protein